MIGTSVMKELSTYLRASMGQTRLRALAFLRIKYDENIDIDNVIDLFTAKKERALEFVNIYDKNIILTSCGDSIVIMKMVIINRNMNSYFKVINFHELKKLQNIEYQLWNTCMCI